MLIILLQNNHFRMRGISIMPSPNPAKFHRRVQNLQNKNDSGNKIERGVTFDWK